MTKPNLKTAAEREADKQKVGGRYYAHGYQCSNCGWAGSILVLKGQSAPTFAECPTCGCPSVVRHVSNVPTWHVNTPTQSITLTEN
jgi:hypothetical protein